MRDLYARILGLQTSKQPRRYTRHYRPGFDIVDHHCSSSHDGALSYRDVLANDRTRPDMPPNADINCAAEPASGGYVGVGTHGTIVFDHGSGVDDDIDA